MVDLYICFWPVVLLEETLQVSFTWPTQALKDFIQWVKPWIFTDRKSTGTNAKRKDTDGRYIVLSESKTRIVLSYHPYIFQIFHLLPMLSIISQKISHCIPIYAINHNLILPHYTNKQCLWWPPLWIIMWLKSSLFARKSIKHNNCCVSYCIPK